MCPTLMKHGPRVLADASHTNVRIGAKVLRPPSIGLRGETKQVGGPDFVLALGAPAPLPSVVASLGRLVRVVLRADRPVLPAKPLAHSAPGRRPWVGNQQALSHGSLHDTPGQQDEPPYKHNEEDTRGVVPWGHVDICHRLFRQPVALVDGIPTPLLLQELLLGLWRCNEVGAMLESPRQPSRQLAGGAPVEEPAAGLERPLRWLHTAGRSGNHVEPESPGDLHAQDQRHDHL
mmetsp:Transcript_137317/g.383061  ORF Transcript_137317/g.383061 Transcript_137317/m.383061 type:complete len:233 (-) Transcript_137317:422-1120(-)